jgi:NADH-quinone oxidoreductase subunit N
MYSALLYALLPLLILSGTVLAILLAIIVKRNFKVTMALSVFGLILTLAVVLGLPHYRPVQASALFKVDQNGLFYLTLLLGSGLFTLAFCYDYFKNAREELIVLLMTALFGTVVLALSSHFASFFVGLETLSISLFALIGFQVDRPSALEASLKYLILSGVASAFLLLGTAFIYAQCSSLIFTPVDACTEGEADLNFMLVSGYLLVLTGIAFKLSLIPFHLWTPDVYQGAPTPIAGFIATASKGALIVVLWRLLADSDGRDFSALMLALEVLAGLSILGGNLLALQQQNLKRLLGYSSITHIGYLLIALMAGRALSPAFIMEILAFYVTVYFLSTLGAFGVLTVLTEPDTDDGDSAALLGLWWRKPWLAAAFTLFLLSLAGLPLTAGFIGKFYIIAAGVQAQLRLMLTLVVIGSGLGLYYYLRLIVLMARKPAGDFSACSAKPISYAALAVLALTVLGLGLVPQSLVAVLHPLPNATAFANMADPLAEP